jgi:hypothetical protein
MVCTNAVETTGGSQIGSKGLVRGPWVDLELNGDAWVKRLLHARSRALAHADRAGIVVEAILVFPISICDPHIEPMCVLRTPGRLTGIENQTDGLGVDLSFSRSARQR